MTAPYLSGTGGLMIDLPHRGNMLVARCRGCGHEVRFTGREIVTRFTKWLPAPVADWAAESARDGLGHVGDFTEMVRSEA